MCRCRQGPALYFHPVHQRGASPHYGPALDWCLELPASSWPSFHGLIHNLRHTNSLHYLLTSSSKMGECSSSKITSHFNNILQYYSVVMACDHFWWPGSAISLWGYIIVFTFTSDSAGSEPPPSLRICPTQPMNCLQRSPQSQSQNNEAKTQLLP